MSARKLKIEPIDNKNQRGGVFAIIVTILLGLKFTLLQNVISPVSYALLFIVAINTARLFFSDQRRKVSSLALSFLVAGALSLIATPFLNPVFRPTERYLLFLTMFIGYGPLLLSEKTSNFRLFVFNNIQLFFVIISLLSFATYLLRIPIAFGRAGFNGITPHPMDLSPIAAFSSLYSTNMYRECQNIKGKIVWALIILVSITTMIIAASRGALVAFGVSVLFYFVNKNRGIGRSIRQIIITSALIIAVVAINPFSMMDNLELKMERIEQTDDITGGRNQSFSKRYQEFESSPIFGVGFSSMTHNDIENGHFEPGSGWTFILSSTGLFGLVTSLLLCVFAIMNVRKCSYLALLSSTCLFFVIHSIIEGYILTVSNGFCLYMWLVMGLSSDKSFLKKYV